MSGPGCISDREPFVLLLDETYSLRLLCTNRDGLDSPDGIALESDDRIVIADREPLRWTEGRGCERLSGPDSGIASPESIVRAGDGTFYMTDDSAGGVWRLDAGGGCAPLAGPGGSLPSTEGIVIAPDNTLLVGDGARGAIFRVTRAGSVSTYIAPGNAIKKAESMVFDEAGNLYIADDAQKQIFIVEPGLEARVLLGSIDGIKSPESLAYYNGHLIIADSETGKLLRWSSARQTLDTIAIFHGNLKDIQAIAVSERGSLYVTVRSRNPKAGYLFKFERRS